MMQNLQRKYRRRMVRALSSLASTASKLTCSSVVITPRTKSDPNATLEEEITSWVAERVPDYKRLRGGVKIVDVIPKGHSGKVLRRAMRDGDKAGTI